MFVKYVIKFFNLICQNVPSDMIQLLTLIQKYYFYNILSTKLRIVRHCKQDSLLLDLECLANIVISTGAVAAGTKFNSGVASPKAIYKMKHVKYSHRRSILIFCLMSRQFSRLQRKEFPVCNYIFPFVIKILCSSFGHTFNKF